MERRGGEGRPNDIFAFRDILSSTPDAFTDLLKLVDIVIDTSSAVFRDAAAPLQDLPRGPIIKMF